MMQVVFEQQEDFPRTISHLANQAVRFLLIDNPRVKHVHDAAILQVRSHEHLLFSGLRKLAFEITKRLQSSSASTFTPGTIFDCINEASTIIDEFADTGEVTDFEHIAALTNYLIRGHGVILEVEERRYEFAHNVFRDALAGQALDRCPPEELRELATQEGWRLPLRYWAGWKSSLPNGGGHVVGIAHELIANLPNLPDAERVIALLAIGEIVAELSSAGAPTQTWAAVGSLRREVAQQFVDALTKPSLPIHLRIRVGDLLGYLTDPRIALPEVTDLHELSRVLASVIGGQATFGRHTAHASSREKFLNVPAFPRVTGTIKSFMIGKYPITNGQYNTFVQDGGYQDRDLWGTAEAQLWLTKDPEFVATLSATVRVASEFHYGTEILTGRLTREDLVSRAQRLIDRREPLFWLDPRFNHPNQPVVGVNYWEANAYCVWLERRWRSLHPGIDLHVCLPTEFEWEFAARRGTADPYPWGTILDLSIPDAHVRDSSVARIGRTSAVGLFPWACWPGGPLDMVGNVWEWTASTVGHYQPGCVAAAPDATGLPDRIVRGTSWLSAEPESAEVTFRSYDPPFNAYEDLGFRISVRGFQP
jgi:formylglycine-generating enzyme required for sulfatase activity